MEGGRELLSLRFQTSGLPLTANGQVQYSYATVPREAQPIFYCPPRAWAETQVIRTITVKPQQVSYLLSQVGSSH